MLKTLNEMHKYDSNENATNKKVKKKKINKTKINPHQRLQLLTS